jgi:hypothetical protein
MLDGQQILALHPNVSGIIVPETQSKKRHLNRLFLVVIYEIIYLKLAGISGFQISIKTDQKL